MTNQAYIQEIAYKLWEAAGKPEGQDLKYWNEASVLVNTINKPKEPPAKESSPEKQSGSEEAAIEAAQPDQT